MKLKLLSNPEIHKPIYEFSISFFHSYKSQYVVSLPLMQNTYALAIFIFYEKYRIHFHNEVT